MKLFSKLFLVIAMGVIIPSAFTFSEIDFDLICEKEGWREQCDLISESACQEMLNQCQTYFEEKRKDIDSDLIKTSAEKNTLKKQIDTLNAKIKDLDYQIYQSNLAIKSLDFQAKETEESIVEIEKEIENQKQKIALILRAVNNVLALQALQKQASATAKQEKDRLYSLTEAQYQAQLKEKEDVETKAAEIAKKLISIIGLTEDQEPPTFGEALELAKNVGNSVGVRPAFLLAIISQESAIGRNVGQCYITDTKTGGGMYSNGKPLSRIIHPTRDLPVFIEIIKDSGRVMEKTPVSCWIPQCVTSYGGKYYYSGASVRNDGSIVCAKSGYVPFGFGFKNILIKGR
ncbi:MAG: Membrane-bound metallopeptidase [Parcubacteria bacterium 34_609]|nr:MAG: Membrane-bound metallopeptidase [Parcubacteria bacterium 34_609]